MTYKARLSRLEARALALVVGAPPEDSADRLLERLRRLALAGHAHGADDSPACRVAMIIYGPDGACTAESMRAGVEAIRGYRAADQPMTDGAPPDTP